MLQGGTRTERCLWWVSEMHRMRRDRHCGSHRCHEPPPAAIAPVYPTSTSLVTPLRCCCRRRCHNRARAGEGQRWRWRRHLGTEEREGGGGGERERGERESFFQPNKTPFLCHSMVFIFSESNASRETVPISVFVLSHVFSTWQITTMFLLGNQVQNLAAEFERGSRYVQN